MIGDIIVDTVFFQAIGDAVPKKESGCLGKPRGPVDPKSVVVINIKANPETRKRITNFVLEIFIQARRSKNYSTYTPYMLSNFYKVGGDSMSG